MQFAHSALTDVGRKRGHNEDSLAFHLGGSQGTPTDRVMLLVADGMGGHSAGDVASRLAVQTFRERLLATGIDPASAFRSAAVASHARIRDEVGEKGEGKGAGTTVVGLLVSGTRAWIGHIGDSRAYRVRNGVIEALTRDHSWVAEQLAAGNLTVEQAAQHPYRNVLTRSLGTASENQEIEVREIDVRPGDVYLLCSDGLYGLVSDAELASAALTLPPEQASRYLVDLANSRGGRDNITVQVLSFPGRRGFAFTRGLVGGLALAACAMLIFLVWTMLSGPERSPVRGLATPLQGESAPAEESTPRASSAVVAPSPVETQAPTTPPPAGRGDKDHVQSAPAATTGPALPAPLQHPGKTPESGFGRLDTPQTSPEPVPPVQAATRPRTASPAPSPSDTRAGQEQNPGHTESPSVSSTSDASRANAGEFEEKPDTGSDVGKSSSDRRPEGGSDGINYAPKPGISKVPDISPGD